MERDDGKKGNNPIIVRLLDRYILKKLLLTYVYVIFLVVFVILIIDATEKNDDFIKHGLSIKQILPYYRDLIPYIVNLITSITTFITVVLVTAKMARHTELVAILSSGISFRRLMLPYFMFAMIIAVLNFFMTGWIIPNTNKTRIAFEIKYVKNPFYYTERNIHLKESPDTYFYMESYSNTSDIGHKFTLETIKGNQVISKLSSRKIVWNEERECWVLPNYSIRQFDGFKETVTTGLKLDTVLNITPKDFGSNYSLQETFTLTELYAFIDELTMRGADDVLIYEIEKYIRYMSPFAVIILTFIGLIVSARKARGGIGFQVALGFVIAFIYIIFFIMSKAIAEANSLNPILAVWLPNITFTGIGWVMYKTVPR